MSNNRHNQQRRCCYSTVTRGDCREKCERLRLPNVAAIIAAGESCTQREYRNIVLKGEDITKSREEKTKAERICGIL